MGKKEKDPLPSFREIVSMRFKKDTIMNGFATAVVLVLPLIVLAIVELLITGKVGKFEDLEPFNTLITQVIMNLEMFVIMAILYQMYRRLRTHAQRDKLWRQSLIQFANRMGADSTGLEELDRKIRNREHFLLTPIIVLLMVAMFVYCVILFLHYIPFWAGSVMSDTFIEQTMYVGFGLCLAQLILIFLKVLTYAYRHERRQCEFTLELSKRLAEVGVTVPPMIRIVSHHNILFHIILLIFTGGIYTIWLGFQLFKGMNTHLTNQWVYENEMLKVVESDGKEKFTQYMPDYFADTEMDKKEFKRMSSRHTREIRGVVKSLNKMPKSLIIAEFFLIVLCANYILKMIALDCEIATLYPSVFGPLFESPEAFIDKIVNLSTKEITDLVMIPVDLILLMITISAMMGIASRRPSSWRKVTRSCLTFVIPLWVSFFGLTNNSGLTHIFDFQEQQGLITVTVILAAVFFMMLLSRNIKEFYTPLDDEPPGILTWIRFVFFGNLDSKDKDVNVDLEDVDSAD